MVRRVALVAGLAVGIAAVALAVHVMFAPRQPLNKFTNLTSDLGDLRGALPGPFPSCYQTSQGGAISGFRGASAQLTAVRVARVGDVDQVTFELTTMGSGEAIISWQVSGQPTARFANESGGPAVELSGSTGLGVLIRGTTARGSYRGSADIKPGLTLISEVAQVSDAGNHLTWAIGVNGTRCYEVRAFDDPPRLEVDVRATGVSPPPPDDYPTPKGG
jgi:hypothetical protein